MAFAKGRAFVILNRMAESGNSEAKKILSNLNSMSQEDLDSKLSTLFGKGGASKEGDTAPKDEKGGKAPKGKETAPKGKKEPKEGKVVANKDFDPNKEGVQSIFGTEEENAKSKDKQVFNTMEEVAKPKEMKSAKDGIKPLKSNQDKSKDLYEFVENADNERVNQLVKETPALSPYLAEFETYVGADDEFNLEGFAEYLDAQSENVEDTPEKNAEVKAVKAFVDKKLGRDTKAAVAPGQKINDKNENFLGRKDAMTIRGDDAAKEKELYDFVGSAEKEMPELSSYLAEFETYIDNDDILTMQGFAEYLDAQSENVEDTPEKNAEVKAVKAFVDGKLGRGQNKTVAPKEMTSAKDGIKPLAPEQQINDNNKNYLGKRKFMTEPNSEVEREINSILSDGTKEDQLAGIAALKEKYESNKVNLAALDKLEQEIEQEDSGKEDYFKLEDEFETMVDNDGTNSMEVVSQLKEKYKGDATKQQALDKLEGKEKFRAATKEYLEKNKETSPLWAKSGMTGNQKLWDAERVRDAMFDFINDEPTIEAALAEAKSVFEGSKGSEEFINYLEQKLLGKDNKGSATNPMTSATEGIKPVEAPKSNDPLKQGKNGFVAFYKGKTYEVFGDSKYEAQQKLAKALGVKKAYDIALELAEQDGKQVKITPDF